MIRQLFSLTILFSSFSFSQAGEPDIKLVLAKLRQSPLVTFEVEKKTKSELLGSETIAPGTIYLSSKKFRWDTLGNENSKIIYDGKVVWTIQEPPKGFKAPPQITKMRLDKKSEGQVFLNSLFQENFNSQFILTKKEKLEKSWDFYLKSKQKNSGINQLKIKVSVEKEIQEISYTDEIQNKIVIAVNKTTLSKKTNEKLFHFKPPMGAQVNEL